MPKRILRGTVVSTKNRNTITVKVERKFKHALYKKKNREKIIIKDNYSRGVVSVLLYTLINFIHHHVSCGDKRCGHQCTFSCNRTRLEGSFGLLSVTETTGVGWATQLLQHMI